MLIDFQYFTKNPELLKLIKPLNGKTSAMLRFLFVGTTGFEPATTRPPDVCATGLRYVPIQGTAKLKAIDLFSKR